MHSVVSSFLSRHLLDSAHSHRSRMLAGFHRRQTFCMLPDEERKHWQNSKLADLLLRAKRHVPVYKDVLASYSDLDIRDDPKEILRGMPIMTRHDIQHDPKRFIADDAGEVFTDATGGSTGTPMEFKISRETHIAREASLFWANNLSGWRPGQKIAMLWGSDADCQSSLQLWRLQLRWWLENRRWYNAFAMSQEQIHSYHTQMASFGPDIVVAYAGAAFELVTWLRAHGISPSYPSIGIITSAEVLLPGMRETIEAVFRRPVFNRYGNREFGAIAAECTAHQGMHVNEMDCIVEMSPPGMTGGYNKIIITYLCNDVMPFIRYDTGDICAGLTSDNCRCGCRTARLDRIAGRQSDMIRTSSGHVIHGEFITHLFYHINHIKQFQFIQDSLTHYRLLVAGDQKAFEAHAPEWEKRIREQVGAEATVEIVRVDAIPVLSSGKRRFTISRIGQSTDA